MSDAATRPVSVAEIVLDFAKAAGASERRDTPN
jgi:hypothetical protein